MGIASSILQGFLFAGMNSAVLAYVAEVLESRLRMSFVLLPRLLIFVFCTSFVLGSALVDSTTMRYDETYGALIGPIGTFIAVWLATHVIAVVALVTNEYAIMTTVVFAVAYAYGHAKASTFNGSKIACFINTIVLLLATVFLMVDAPYLDEVADQLGVIFGTAKSSLPPNYLAGKGGIFAVPVFAPLVISLGSFGLMRAQSVSPLS